MACLVYLGMLLVLSLLQSRLIFPGQKSQGCSRALVHSGPDRELVELTTVNGERVVALFGPALSSDGSSRPDAAERPTILFFYGNGDCLAGCSIEFERFRRLGANVLIPDYLGYGLSGGVASERSCYETADTALAYLKSRPDVASDRIIATGWSLGGAVAIDLASREPVAGLAAFSTFTSMGDMVRLFYPIPGLRRLLKHRFESIAKIPSVRCPILLGHGTRDELIPDWMADRLAEAAGGPVRLFRLPAGHGDFFAVAPHRIEEELGRLVDHVAQAGRSEAGDSGALIVNR